MFARLKLMIQRTHPKSLDQAAAMVWEGHALGAIDDDEAASLLEFVQFSRRLPAALERSIFPARKNQVSPDREASKIRRRKLASAGGLPPELAAHFTTGELAVVTLIGAAQQGRGFLDWSLDKLAAAAGVCRRTAQYAVHKAVALRLIVVRHRPLTGRKHQTNIIKVLCQKWSRWLARRMTCKTVSPTNTSVLLSTLQQRATPCNNEVSEPYSSAWKRLISPFSPGPSDILNRPQR